MPTIVFSFISLLSHLVRDFIFLLLYPYPSVKISLVHIFHAFLQYIFPAFENLHHASLLCTVLICVGLIMQN